MAVVLATIIFSIELQKLVPSVLAEDLKEEDHSAKLYDLPQKERFTVKDDKQYIPVKEVDLKKQLKETYQLAEEIKFYDLDVVLINNKEKKRAIFDITLHLKDDKTLELFKAVEENIKNDIIILLSKKEESEVSNPYSLERLKEEIQQEANSYFDQYVVTKIILNRIELVTGDRVVPKKSERDNTEAAKLAAQKEQEETERKAEELLRSYLD